MKVVDLLSSAVMLLSLATFLLGSGPYTPALLLVFVLIPLALFVTVKGAWRRGLLCLYFCGMALFGLKLTMLLHLQFDSVFFLILGVGGLLALLLLLQYLLNRKPDAHSLL